MTGILLDAALVGLLALIIHAFFIEPYRIHVSNLELEVPGLEPELDGFTICHLSDTHTRSFGRFEALLAKSLSRVKCDLCVVTGDLVNSREGLDALTRALWPLNTKHGIFAVPGNNDYKSGVAIPEIARILEESGTRLLVNESITLLTNGLPLHIIGVDDPFLAHDDIVRAAEGLGASGFRLLIAHSPDVIVRLCDIRPDLILAGHTHAGQIRVPILGALAVHNRYRLGISHGHLESDLLTRKSGCDLNGVQMYVSRGLSGGIIRARLMSPPEVVLITLRGGFRAA